MYSSRDLVKEYLTFKYPIKLQGYKTKQIFPVFHKGLSTLLNYKVTTHDKKKSFEEVGLSTLLNYKVTKRLNSKEKNNEATLMGGFFITYKIFLFLPYLKGI
jgi:Cu/Ag efflux pump CusA